MFPTIWIVSFLKGKGAFRTRRYRPLLSCTILSVLLAGANVSAAAQSSSQSAEQEEPAEQISETIASEYRRGTTALAAGNPVDAVFALSRVIIADPDHIAARFALARAYAHLGDLEAARREIAIAAGQADIPRGLATVLERYVAALDSALADRDAALETAVMDSAYRRGIALLDAGRTAEAVALFKEILAARPDHLPARAELGRAYALQGDYAAAQRELATVAGNEKVPTDVRNAINRYVAVLDARLEGARHTRVSGYIRVRSGYDSNVNNATDEERILIPAFSALGLATLSPDAREQDDAFAETTARLSVAHATSARNRLLADLSANFRKNFDEAHFDQITLGGSLGHAWQSRTHGTFTVAAQAQTFLVDRDIFRNAFGMLAGWSRTNGSGTDLALNLQYSYLDFPDDDTRDAHRITLGGTVGGHAGHATYIFGGAYAGREATVDGRFDHLSQWFVGGRAGIETRTSQRLSLSALLLAERQIYDETEPLFMAARRTWRIDMRGGARYRLVDNVDLLVEAAYTRADSNIVLFDYNRVTASLGLEYAF